MYLQYVAQYAYILLMYVDVEMHGCRVVEHCASASTWPLKFTT